MKSQYKIIWLTLLILASALVIQVFRVVESSQFLTILQPPLSEDWTPASSSDMPVIKPRILILYSDKDPGSRAIHNNITHVLKMARVTSIVQLPIDSGNIQSVIRNMNPSGIVLFATEGINVLKSPNSIIEFVSKGGHVCFLTRCFYPAFNSLTGIISYHGYHSDVPGFIFKKQLFPGLDHISIKNRLIYQSSLDVVLVDNIRVLAESANHIPLIWTHQYGRGNVTFTNSSLFEDKLNRGLLLQLISYSSGTFLHSILNSKVFDIDDFPAPVPHGSHKVIQSQYHMDNERFYRYIWWSDMEALARKYQIRYTGMAIGLYNTNTHPPLPDINKQAQGDLLFFGRKLIENRGEIAIHGYNHNSLCLPGDINFNSYGYSPWSSVQDMIKGLSILHRTLNNLYGPFTISTYVPPSNILSVSGKIALKEAFPDLKVIGGLYTGYPELGVLYQEFGQDPHLDGVYMLPRFSSGYTRSDSELWAIYNGIASIGMFHHFVHPDDVLDHRRSQDRTWKDLFEDLEYMINHVHSFIPFLRPMTNREAYLAYRKYEQMSYKWESLPNAIRIYHQNTVFPVYHLLRLDHQYITHAEGASYDIIQDASDYLLYLLECSTVNVTVHTKERNE